MHPDCPTAETIRLKKARYCRYLDTKQWASLEALTFPDTQLSFHQTDGSISTAGKANIVFGSPRDFTRAMAELFKNADTLHHIGHGELEQISEDEVHAVWGMEDQLNFRSPLPLNVGGFSVRGGGYYHEVWRRKEGDWFLAELRLERTYFNAGWWASFLMRLARVFG